MSCQSSESSLPLERTLNKQEISTLGKEFYAYQLNKAISFKEIVQILDENIENMTLNTNELFHLMLQQQGVFKSANTTIILFKEGNNYKIAEITKKYNQYSEAEVTIVTDNFDPDKIWKTNINERVLVIIPMGTTAKN